MTGRKTMVLRTFALAVLAAAVMWAQPASAVDAPKWIAAMYLEAQATAGLRWQPVAGATGYKVLRSTAAGKEYTEVAAPTQPQYMDTAVTPGTTYYYVLQAVAGAETSPNSAEKSVVVTQAKKAEPPGIATVAMDVNAGGIKVTWKPAKDAVAYNVYRRESFKPAGKEDLIGSVSNAEPYLDKANLKKGVEYVYSVSALDGAFNESPKSSTLSAKFAPKEEVAVVKKAEEKVVANRPVKFIAEFAYEKEEGVELRGVANVARVTVCDGDIVVFFANGPRAEIQFFDEKFRFDRRLKSDGKDPKLFSPGMTYFVCGESNDIIGVNTMTRTVDRVSLKDGSILNSFPMDNGRKPEDPLDANVVAAVRLAVKDDEIFVGDLNNMVVRVFDMKGKLLRRIGEGYGPQLGKFSVPADMAFLKDGRIAVLEAAGARVQILSKDEKPLFFFAEEGKREGQFARASGMSYEPKKDLLYASDFLNNVIHVFKTDGTVAGTIKFADPAKQRTFNSPAGVNFSDGLIYVIDYGTMKVLVLQDEG